MTTTLYRRTLSPVTHTALDVLVQMQALPMGEFLLRMHQQGFNAYKVTAAIGSLERRGWALRDAGRVTLTDDGREIAARGIEAVPPKRTAFGGRSNRRMPAGLF